MREIDSSLPLGMTGFCRGQGNKVRTLSALYFPPRLPNCVIPNEAQRNEESRLRVTEIGLIALKNSSLEWGISLKSDKKDRSVTIEPAISSGIIPKLKCKCYLMCPVGNPLNFLKSEIKCVTDKDIIVFYAKVSY